MNISKCIAAGFAGGIVGFAIGYFVGKSQEHKKSAEEMNDMRNYYHKKYNHQEELLEKAEDIKAQGEMIRETQEKLDRVRTQYDTFSDVNSKEEFLATLESPREDPTVYDISAEDFINGAITYDKVSLRLYSDGTVAKVDGDLGEDEETEVVIADDLIGIENLNRLIDGDEDGLYLRDDDRQVDYEIDKVEMAYSELLGEI